MDQTSDEGVWLNNETSCVFLGPVFQNKILLCKTKKQTKAAHAAPPDYMLVVLLQVWNGTRKVAPSAEETSGRGCCH